MDQEISGGAAVKNSILVTNRRLAFEGSFVRGLLCFGGATACLLLASFSVASAQPAERPRPVPARPANPEPSRPDPAEPEAKPARKPARPEPARPDDSARPAPAGTDPAARPAPARPDPARPAPPRPDAGARPTPAARPEPDAARPEPGTARPEAPARPKTTTKPREEGEGSSDPFKPPKAPPPRVRFRPWFMKLLVGASMPAKSNTKPLPKAGFQLSLGAGRVLWRKGTLRINAELHIDLHSLMSNDSVVLNPDSPTPEQIVCKDKKGLTHWSLMASFSAQWLFKRTSAEVGFGCGGAYSEYVQLRPPSTPSSGDTLTCNQDDVKAWLGVIGGFLRFGYSLSPRMELAVQAGIYYPILSSSVDSRAEKLDLNGRDIFPVFIQLGAIMIHRF